MPPPPASDACPGLLALHPARDGHVARIRLPGGYVTGPRWRALAGLARDFGDGHLDLTSRGNVQLRGLRAGDADELARPRGRRRACCRPPPTTGPATSRPARWPAWTAARRCGRWFARWTLCCCARPELAALPGRFLFSLDDGTGGAGLAACDVGLLPVRRRPWSWSSPGGSPACAPGAGRAAGGRRWRAARAAIAAGVGHAVSRIADLPDGGASVAAALGGALGAPAAGPDCPAPARPRPSRRGTAGHRARKPSRQIIR